MGWGQPQTATVAAPVDVGYQRLRTFLEQDIHPFLAAFLCDHTEPDPECDACEADRLFDELQRTLEVAQLEADGKHEP